MLKDNIEIDYRFECADGATFDIPVRLDAESLDLVYDPPDPAPAWTSMAHEACTGCPLASEGHTHCPAALAIVDLVERFDTMISYEQVLVTVETAGRTITKRTSMQKALSSLLGLHMATSGCPSLSFLKPMARFHLPFATRLETAYRVASAYMLAQYFRNRKGKICDLDLKGLSNAYEQIQRVNRSIANRLRTAGEGDANMNALILLDVYAQDLPLVIEDGLESVAFLFDDYLDSGAWRPVTPVE